MGLFVLLFYVIVVVLMVGASRLGGMMATNMQLKSVGRFFIRFAFVLAVYFAFFWKQVPATIQLINYCQSEARTDIYRTATNVEGVLGHFATEKPLFEAGYRFVERYGSAEGGHYGKFFRYTYDPQKAWFNIPRIEVSPPTRYEHRWGGHSVSKYVAQNYEEIYDREKDEVMARRVGFHFQRHSLSDWDRYTQFWLSFGSCSGRDMSDKQSLITKVLKPIDPPRKVKPAGSNP